MNTQNEIREIAREIMRQLGSNKFVSMTGAKGFTFHENEKGNIVLAFKIGRNSKNINFIRIEYVCGLDLYNMEFINFRNSKSYDCSIKQIAIHEHIYNDMLVPIFEQETGMHTKLF
jgi:hypothetical protein